MKKMNLSLLILSLALALGPGREAGAEEARDDSAELKNAAVDEGTGPAPETGYSAAPKHLKTRPGLAAAPGKGPPPGPFAIRPQRTDGPWPGVAERDSARAPGREVISRPGGEKVYRYYSGRPGAPRNGADPLREERNREDTIYDRGRN